LCTGRRPEWFAAAVASRTMVSEEDGYVPHRSCVTVSLVDRPVNGSVGAPARAGLPRPERGAGSADAVPRSGAALT
jgi:hypothetical protein